jgi:hypothetical protein
MGILAIVYCVVLFTNFSIYGIPSKYSLTLFNGGQFTALEHCHLRVPRGVSLSVFSTLHFLQEEYNAHFIESMSKEENQYLLEQIMALSLLRRIMSYGA